MLYNKLQGLQLIVPRFPEKVKIGKKLPKPETIFFEKGICPRISKNGKMKMLNSSVKCKGIRNRLTKPSFLEVFNWEVQLFNDNFKKNHQITFHRYISFENDEIITYSETIFFEKGIP